VLCYGTDKPSCGEARGECKPGTYSPHGVAPCTLCPKGTWQSASKATSCVACDALTNTSKRGAMAAVRVSPLRASCVWVRAHARARKRVCSCVDVGIL
jgi:hypothetical protein